MKRTKYEQETSITWNLEEPHALLWTCQPAMLRKLSKLGAEMYRNDGEGKAFKIPKNWIGVRKPKIMNLTEEQRKALSDRIKSNLH